MEENEVILLKKSKINVAAVGKWTNIFSIFAAIGLLLMVALGVAMLYYSGKLDYSTPYYLDNILLPDVIVGQVDRYPFTAIEDNNQIRRPI